MSAATGLLLEKTALLYTSSALCCLAYPCSRGEGQWLCRHDCAEWPELVSLAHESAQSMQVLCEAAV